MPLVVAICMSENPNAFKHMIGAELLARIAASLQKSLPAFDKQQLLSLLPELLKRELKQRVSLIREELRRQLPTDFPTAIRIILASLKLGNLRGFDLWPYTEFIQTYGLEHPEISLEGLRKLTPLFTSEFAVRPFLIKHRRQTLAYLLNATKDKDVHVRRWASEGTRPRLPWGERLDEFVKEPTLTLAILEKLKNDSELYIRKSVANHLNDIAKDHPQLVLSKLKSWQKSANQKTAPNINWIVRHALRSLIKSGNREALKLIGATANPQISLNRFTLKKYQLEINEYLSFEFEICSSSNKKQKLVVDYIIYFRMANNKISPKVFKLKTFDIDPKATFKIKKNHHMKLITTRRYYPGEHFVEIQVNGKPYAKSKWHLKR